MKQSNTDHLEMIIKEALKDELENTPEPALSTDKAWKQLKSNLDKKHSFPKKHRFFTKILYAACALFFVASLLFFVPHGGQAYSTFTDIFQTVQDNVVRIFAGVGGDDPETGDPHAPDMNDVHVIEGSEGVAKIVSLEEAQEEAAFKIQLPNVLPDGFTLKDVTIITTEIAKSGDIYLNYENDEADFVINQKSVGEQFGYGSVADADDVQVETIEVNGQEAVLSQFDGYIELVWVTQTRFFSINGTISKEQIIKVANSL